MDPVPASATAASFEALALPHLPVLARVARALTRDPSAADDLVQETFLRALRHWGTFDPGSDCRRWLLTICRNAHFAQHHREQRVTAVEDEELESLAAVQVHRAARAAGVDDLYARVDLGPAIRRAIDGLEPIFRSVVVLYDVEGFTYEEVAELLAIPLGTVRSRLYRARRLLQEALLAYALDAGFPAARAVTSPPAGA